MNNRVEIIYYMLYKKVENTSIQISYSELKVVYFLIYVDAAIGSSVKTLISQKGK